jgi:enoyl-CoA hydratase/carnithine racemase
MSTVITQDLGPIRHVILNRPEKRNAMSQALLRELAQALSAAANAPSVHCVVLRGEGPVFSAGVDLGELASFASEPAVLRPFRGVFLDCANLCEEMPKPVVCQIHGACFGGALEVALGCDLRVASTDSQLGLPEVRFGIIPDVGGSSRLPAVVGLGRAKELIMTARTIDASEAHAIGLVNRLAAPDELERVTQELADELLAHSPVAVGRAKRVMDASARPALAQTLELEVAVQEYCVAALREAARAGAATAGQDGAASEHRPAGEPAAAG